MSADLKALRKVAEAATPGPWFVYDRGIGYEVHHASGYELNNGQRETFTKSDATHIATFDPTTALALIEALTRVSTLFVDVTIDHGNGVTEDLNATIKATITRALDGDTRG